MPIELLFQIAVLVMSVVIHEVAHGQAAYFLGDPTAKYAGRLTLNPLKHLDWFGSVLLPALLVLTRAGFIFGWAKPVPYNPYNLRAGRWGPAYVAAAGPATNFLIAVVFSLLLRLLAVTASAGLPQAAPAFIGLIVLLNLMLAIFNLIPVPPLDGSRILLALLPERWRGVEEWLARYQLFIAIIFLFVLINTDWLPRLVFLIFRFLTGLV